jgi:Right handed beta helix region
VADADEITIRNNVFYNFGRGWPIHRYYSRGSPVRGLVIVNNTFVGANPYRPGQIILASPTDDLRIENNIFHSPQSAALFFDHRRFSHALVRKNMTFPGETKVGRTSGVRFEDNWEGVDPKLTNDFQLEPGSPAIDVGLPLPEVTHDANGAARPQGRGYDLGAYER